MCVGVWFAQDWQLIWGAGVRGEYDPASKKPYKTGELARILGCSRNKVIRMVGDGDFGAEGVGWRWTSGGPHKGDRIIRASFVKAYLERNS